MQMRTNLHLCHCLGQVQGKLLHNNDAAECMNLRQDEHNFHMRYGECFCPFYGSGVQTTDPSIV